MSNFEDATKEAAAMFENEQATKEQVQSEVTESQEENAEQMSTVEQSEQTLEQAVETAEAAAQAAVDKNAENEQLKAENRRLAEQNQMLQNSITQMSEQHQKSLVANVAEEEDIPPTFDFESAAFDDPETARAKQQKYAEDMANYARKGVMREMQPFIERAREADRAAEKETLITELEAIPEISDVRELLPQMEHIISVNPILAADDVSMKDKLIIAYAMAKGVNVINNPHKDPTTDELMQLYDKMPDFQDAIEKRRIDKVKDSQQVPTHSASSGAVNAALNFDKKPQTLDEATESVKKLFR